MSMGRRTTQFLYFVVGLMHLTVMSNAAVTTHPFYIIAHMTNSRISLDWAVWQGANAVEQDIKFDGSGKPYLFEHGGFCDCSCPHPKTYHICNGALGDKCSGTTASDGAEGHLRHLAKMSRIALVIMDGKVDPKWGSLLRTAGTNLVTLLENNLFAYGYRGKVVISAGKINSYDYVYSAALAAARTSHRNRYYFSFDQEADNYQGVAAMLSRFTKNRVFGTGISSCVPGNYQSGIRQAVEGVRKGQLGMSYIWTLDKVSSMKTYINLGVQGIITNRVGLLLNVVKESKLRRADYNDRIPVARYDVASSRKCDCDYHSGGCTISSPAPVGLACKCSYKGFWTCGGSIVGCSMSHWKCRNPDASKDACRLGGGDCGGY